MYNCDGIIVTLNMGAVMSGVTGRLKLSMPESDVAVMFTDDNAFVVS